MRQFSLRTLILVMLLGGPVLAVLWWISQSLLAIELLTFLLVGGVAFCILGAVFVLAAAACGWTIGMLIGVAQRLVDFVSRPRKEE
jgi:hypothetical protein